MRRRCYGLLAGVLTCTLVSGHRAQAQMMLSVPTDDYPTIQQALDTAVAGDTVRVGRGSYGEDFTLKTGVVVQGEETAVTFLTGTVGVALGGAGGTLEHFTVQDPTWKFSRTQTLVLRNCVITGTGGTAIAIENSTDTEITNNVFYDNGTALQFTNVDGVFSTGKVLANAFVDNGTALSAPMPQVTRSHNLFSGNGDTADDPPLADPGFVDAAAADFHLVEASDCVDAVPVATLADPDGSPADCGAYGGPQQDSTPRQVTNLVVTAGTAKNSATLTWTADANYLVTGYLLHYGTTSGVYAGTGAGEGPSPVSVAGRDTASASLGDLTISTTPPSVPTGLAVSPGDRALFLSWDAATGATGYTVLYGLQSGLYTTELDAGNSTAITIGGLSNGVTYYLALRPYNAGTYYFAIGATGTSAEGSTVPPEGQPSAEQTLTFDTTQGEPSTEVSETPGLISGYPDLDDSGFCFLHSLPLPVASGGRRAAGLLGGLLLLVLAVARAGRRRCRRLLAVGLGVALATAAGTARAAPPRWSLDARAGAFWPSDGDWKDHYDQGALPEVKLGVGYRLTTLLELGAEAGYRRAEGTVRSTDGGSPLAQPLGQTLTVVPLQGYALVRLQSSEDQLLVPYLAAGLTSTLYRHEVDGGQNARGRQNGYHARAGVHLSLRRFEPRRAKRNRGDYGLLDSGLTLEAQYSRVDDFGAAATDLGGWSLSAGLALGF